eukprot:m.155963 g.155963  ORF g.155963 m.155963 type:complete len:302 (-) comp16426_c0_seq1:3017-3922(-)
MSSRRGRPSVAERHAEAHRIARIRALIQQGLPATDAITQANASTTSEPTFDAQPTQSPPQAPLPLAFSPPPPPDADMDASHDPRTSVFDFEAPAVSSTTPLYSLRQQGCRSLPHLQHNARRVGPTESFMTLGPSTIHMVQRERVMKASFRRQQRHPWQSERPLRNAYFPARCLNSLKLYMVRARNAASRLFVDKLFNGLYGRASHGVRSFNPLPDIHVIKRTVTGVSGKRVKFSMVEPFRCCTLVFFAAKKFSSCYSGGQYLGTLTTMVTSLCHSRIRVGSGLMFATTPSARYFGLLRTAL